MRSKIPKIGFDRYLDPMWMAMAAEVVRGETTKTDLEARLAMDIKAYEVRIKTTGILNRIWFPAEKERVELAKKAAVIIHKGGDKAKPIAFTAATIAAYPYFGEVLETIGRLIKLQGTCAAGEVHRRMYERHGKRTTIALADAKVFRSLVAWGLLARGEKNYLVPNVRYPMARDDRELMDAAANAFRGSITPLKDGDPLLFGFKPVSSNAL